MTRLLVEELTTASGTQPEKKFRSLKGIAGRWQEEREFDRIIEEQRRIDPEMWK
ncbi:MAG: hypothetical protein HY820_15765 [Acidobacteria bacterium]|nr:hypothetical protein [Acidobacteriota bacterium]